jgi:hypothetical protein
VSIGSVTALACCASAKNGGIVASWRQPSAISHGGWRGGVAAWQKHRRRGGGISGGGGAAKWRRWHQRKYRRGISLAAALSVSGNIGMAARHGAAITAASWRAAAYGDGGESGGGSVGGISSSNGVRRAATAWRRRQRVAWRKRRKMAAAKICRAA